MGGVILLLPFQLLISAGYVATSTNYLWSSVTLLISLLPIKYVQKFSDKKYMYVFCILATIYAGNQEQSGAILLTVYTICLIYHFINKNKIEKFLWIEWGLSIISLVFIFTAPGHIQRITEYTRFGMPDFPTLNALQKGVRGFTSTMAYLLAGKNVIWPLFCFMLFLVAFVKKKDWLVKCIAAIPLVSSLSFGLFQDYLMPTKLKELFCWYPEWGYHMWDYHYIDAITYTEWKYYIPIIFSIVILGIVYLEIFWIFGLDKKGGIIFLTFSAGLCSRLVMGFSQTLYGSSFRTFIFFYFALGIVIVMLFEELLKEHKKIPSLLGGLCFVVGICYTYYMSYQSIL